MASELTPTALELFFMAYSELRDSVIEVDHSFTSFFKHTCSTIRRDHKYGYGTRVSFHSSYNSVASWSGIS